MCATDPAHNPASTWVLMPDSAVAAAIRETGPMASSELRASDADRDRVAGVLREHYSAGRLTDEEMSERVETAYRVRTVAELATLTADLPTASVEAPPPAARARPRRRRSGYETSVRIHATVFLVVNAMLIAIWAAAGGGYFWPIWPILGWGIGLGCHFAPLLATRGAAPRTRKGTGSLRDAPSSVGEVASSVEAERPSLDAAAAPDGTVTLLFSDIEGSTALNERLGDVRWLELLRVHHRVIREQVASYGGYEVKAQGDGFMIAFPSARKAISCALAIQAAIARELRDATDDGPIRVRIGLNTGEAIREESDFYGKNVVVAARIAALARGGEILASSVVKALTESAGDLTFSEPREVELAGLAGTHVVYRVGA
jgi:class 3 adenylate cyclase